MHFNSIITSIHRVVVFICHSHTGFTCIRESQEAKHVFNPDTFYVIDNSLSVYTTQTTDWLAPGVAFIMKKSQKNMKYLSLQLALTTIMASPEQDKGNLGNVLTV